ncbi:ribosome silencing factor [Candidatus Latescibacterota bacterium]
MISNISYNTEKNVERIINLVMEKKGENIVILDLRKITSVADFFIITTGNSNVHVRAIAEEIREKMKKENKTIPWHIEGLKAQKWILIDYVDIVVHIFDYDSRLYYSIEKLWEDAKSRHVKTNY